MSETLAKAIRDALLATGKSHNAIARETGIPQPTITRFLNGRDVRVSIASALADYAGLALSSSAKPAKKLARRKPAKG